MMTNLRILNLILLFAISVNIMIYFALKKEAEFDFDLGKMVPKRNGVWVSKEIPINDYLREGVKADSALWRSYHDGNGNVIEVWVLFYKDQSRSNAHNPITCFDGAGWSTEKDKDTITLKDGATMRMMKIFVTKDYKKKLSYYWYMPAGQIADSEFKQNIYKFYYGLLKSRRDLLFLSFSIDASNKDIRSQENVIKGFIQSFYPSLKNEFPPSYFN